MSTQPTGRPGGPAANAPHPAARAILAWMQANGPRLRGLLDEELRRAGGPDAPASERGPAGDPAIRGHLRYVAEGLAATEAPGDDSLSRFAQSLPAALADAEGARLAEQIDAVGDATAFELELQFGDRVVDDHSIQATADRRVRISAWTRVFLGELDAHRPQAPVGEVALAWMADRQDRLADTIFAMDRRAKEAEIARGGPNAVDDQDVVNRIGQAAMLQAHMRFLVEALAPVLATPRVGR